MDSSLKNLDLIIKKRLESSEDSSKKTTSDIHPFYVTSEEVNNLLRDVPTEDVKKTDALLPGLEILGKLFNLNDLEKKSLLVIMAPEIDSKYERIYAYFQDDLNRKYPTIALISLLLSENGGERHEILHHFSPRFPLCRFSLIKFADAPSEVPLMHRPLKIEESVRNFILGFHVIDNRIRSFSKLIPPSNGQVNSSNMPDLIKGIKKGLEEKKRFLVHFHGPSGLDKIKVAQEIAAGLGYGLLKINTPVATQNFQSLEDLIGLIVRESILSGTIPYLDNFDSFFGDEKYRLNEPIFFDLLDEFSWLIFSASNKKWKPRNLPKDNLFLEFPFPRPSFSETARLWKAYMEGVDRDLAREISAETAQLFKFTEGEIQEVVHKLEGFKFTNRKIDKKAVYDVCREKVSAELDHLAQNLKLSYSIGDIVLLDEQRKRLQNIISGYRNQYKVFEHWGFKKNFQSQGIASLFIGPPGTGKTMSAAIMANELGLDLYRIDLSQVVSKYIGETEKNLAKIFEAADGAGVILFFDEADALFGKRTEVKDAHDRYANIEVSYLLQRIEEYNGPVILASNFKRNIDESFVRRIHFVLEFPFPDEEMREEIWKKVFPENAPLDKETDFKFLAKNFKLSGANIRNVALSSAFFAAEDSGTIGMRHIVEGLKCELQKMGKRYEPSDFGPYWA